MPLKLFPGESSGQFHEAFRNFPSRPNGMQYFCRYEREVSSLKDVLASLQSPADNDIAQKISEYETTVADYEVQVGYFIGLNIGSVNETSLVFFQLLSLITLPGHIKRLIDKTSAFIYFALPPPSHVINNVLIQVTMLKKNISDLHTRLHNTYDERQKVIEKAQVRGRGLEIPTNWY